MPKRLKCCRGSAAEGPSRWNNNNNNNTLICRQTTEAFMINSRGSTWLFGKTVNH